MPNESPGQGVNEITRIRKMQFSDGNDLEKTLEAAERMLAEADAHHRHEQNRTFAACSMAVVVITALAVSLFVFYNCYWMSHYFAPIAASLVSVASLILTIVYFRVENRRNIQYDFRMRLVGRLVGLINESYLEVAEREQWSYLRREATKIRLSIFPLESPRTNFGRKLRD
jgi:hypothetical protein